MEIAEDRLADVVCFDVMQREKVVDRAEDEQDVDSYGRDDQSFHFWSPDGRRIAFLLFDRGLRLEVADVKERDAR
jgi:hypothetical protein